MIRQTGFEEPLFADGVNGMISAAIPVKIGGKQGWQNVLVSGTTKRGVDLAEIPDLTLPPASTDPLATRRGGWLIRHGFQQFLWQDPGDPRIGWGLFGDVTVWDSNPTPFEWGMSLGVTGNTPFSAARPGDRFGLGYFRFSLASDIVQAVDPLLRLNAEQGVEAFYTFELRPELALTASVQWLDPARSDVGSSLLTGLRIRTRF